MSISPCPDTPVKEHAATANVTTKFGLWRRRINGRVVPFDPSELQVDNLDDWEPFRSVASSKRSRNIVVAVWSVTAGCVRELESGLEHDLHRRLDRSRVSRAVLPQPFQLPAALVGKLHVPDFLQIGAAGDITVWDCRPDAKIDSATREVFDRTRQAMAALGWNYEVFTGMGTEERKNSMFVNGYRVTTTRRGRTLRPWIAEKAPLLLVAARQPTTIGELFARDDGSGETIAALWHLIARGDLAIDMTEPITDATRVVTA